MSRADAGHGAMLCHPLEELRRVLRALLTGMFTDNNNLDTLLDKNRQWDGLEEDLALCVYLREADTCPCREKHLEEAECSPWEWDDDESPLCSPVTPDRPREGPAMWPTLNKSQRVQLANTNMAMEWTVAGLYLCRFLHRRVSMLRMAAVTHSVFLLH